MNKVVLDANVYVKLFKKEHDSDKVSSLVNKLVSNSVDMVQPHVVVNETITTCEYAQQDIQEVNDFFKALINFRMKLIDLTPSLLDKTLEITKQGHEKSGFPTFNDSMNHAIAIEEEALFITADRRHYEKTKHLGNIELLSNLN